MLHPCWSLTEPDLILSLMVLASDYAAVYVQQRHLDQLFRIQP